MRIPSKLRAHIYASGILVLVTGAAYTAYKCAIEIRKWTMAAPRLQHQEMEEFLRWKEEQSRKKMAQN